MMLTMGTSGTGNRTKGAIWIRDISLKRLRVNHRATYYVLVASAWAVLWFFIFLFLLLLFSAINPWIYARVITSGSMEPTIKKGSLVIIIPHDEYRQGDIISFNDPVIGNNNHRIVGIVNSGGVTYFITKGDAATMPDHIPVTMDRIVGKIVLTFPYLGYAAYFGLFAALVPIILIVFHFIRKRRSRTAGENG